MAQISPPPARTAMHYMHLELGAEMVEREGWTLPARYSDPKEEAAGVRQAVGIADISPIGKIRLHGESIDDALRGAVPGCERTPIGSVFVNRTDLRGPTVARFADDDCLVLTESTNVDSAIDAFKLDERTHPVNMTSVLAAVRIVGPNAPAVFAAVAELDLAPHCFQDLACVQTRVADIHGAIIRKDIDGLLSYDLLFGRDYGEHVWKAINEAGERCGITPFGLEAMSLLHG